MQWLSGRSCKVVIFQEIEPQGAFSEMRSRHICFMEDNLNLLHVMSKLWHVQLHVVTKVLCIILNSVVHKTNIEVREPIKWWSLTIG